MYLYLNHDALGGKKVYREKGSSLLINGGEEDHREMIEMPRQPTDTEQRHDHQQHLDRLKRMEENGLCVNNGFYRTLRWKKMVLFFLPSVSIFTRT